MRRYRWSGARPFRFYSVLAAAVPTFIGVHGVRAEQPPAPGHTNATAVPDKQAVANRGDVVNLPTPLKDRLIQLADRPHTYLPMQAFAEASNNDGSPKPSQLFQYYLLDTTGGFPPNVSFEANVFTTQTPGINDHVQLTVTGANCGLQTIGTVDGKARDVSSEADHFPDKQTNVVPLHVSMGAYNAMQQSDVHSYWEFNYQGTNWVHPLYELPFTGGFPDNLGQAPDAFQDGEIGALQSIVPGPGPGGERNKPQVVGDNPNLPREPDKFDPDPRFDAQRAFRERGGPSGLANEIYLDVYERMASFKPNVRDIHQRLFDAYAPELRGAS